MTFKKLKQRFEGLGYELKFMTLYEGRGYYLRKFGSTNYSIFENSRSAIESRLDFLEYSRKF